jgi:hypothetical protein
MAYRPRAAPWTIPVWLAFPHRGQALLVKSLVTKMTIMLLGGPPAYAVSARWIE